MNRARDPRIRQTLDRLTTTLESANTATQTSFYDFFAHYVGPCLQSVNVCLEGACAPCVGVARDRARQRQRAALRSQRPEAVFDFYADWDEDAYEYGAVGASEVDAAAQGGTGEGSGARANEQTGLLSGWGVGELDRVLAGKSKTIVGGTQQPKRQRGMSYGTTAKTGGRRRGSTGPTVSAKDDPTLLPTSSKFGFLERLPFRVGARGIRYQPSAANLQEGLLQRRSAAEEDRSRTEGEALLEESEEEGVARTRRARSGTMESGNTDTSYSSRGDLFPSDEDDDAVMLDDGFEMALARRNTEDSSGSPSRRRKRPSVTRKSTSTKSRSSRSLASKGRTVSGESIATMPGIESDSEEPLDLPTEEDLRREEEQVRQEEEAEIQRKRQAAQELAIARGLATPGKTGRDGLAAEAKPSTQETTEEVPLKPPSEKSSSSHDTGL